MQKRPLKKRPADIAHAKLAPEEEFDHPGEVVRSTEIGKSEKKKILDQWEVDSQALSRANDEGMTGGEPTKLSEVQRAKRKMASPADRIRDRRTSGKPAH